jgi:hypothetical protein
VVWVVVEVRLEVIFLFQYFHFPRLYGGEAEKCWMYCGRCRVDGGVVDIAEYLLLIG